MNANTKIDLGTLHQAIEADIAAAFPQLQLVEFYREDRKQLKLPACLLTLAEMEALPEDDPGTEQLAVMAKFEAELVVGFRKSDGVRAKQIIRVMAGALAAWLRKRRWNDPGTPGKKLPTGAAEVLGAYPDDFRTMTQNQNGELPQFEIWRVEWQQIIHLGDAVEWDGGVVPMPVYSWTPDIGPGHEDDYQDVMPEADL